MAGTDTEPRSAAEIAAEQAGEQAGEQEPSLTRAQQLARDSREARERGESEVQIEEDDPAREAREAVASGEATPDDIEATTEWLLSDEPPEVMTRKLKVRVGGSDENPRYMTLIIGAISIDTIRLAERDASGNRAARRGGRGGGGNRYDEMRANLRVIVEATVKPDLKEVARAAGFADATELLLKRLSHKPGVVAQLAGQVMEISGFDETDVEAAGN